MKNYNKILVTLFVQVLVLGSAFSSESRFKDFRMNHEFSSLFNVKSDPHLPISHCYHWLNESSNKYLAYKYSYASSHKGEMTFYTDPSTSNGSVAGPGLYCGKTPGDSYSYGDRVIRVDFVKDIVMLDETTGKQYCGYDGKFYPTDKECQSKPWDIKFYTGGGKGNYAWYVIRNPQAVEQWSANSDQLINDLNAEKPFENTSYGIHADNTIRLIKQELSKRTASIIINENARLSIIELIKDPSKLNQIPPLTVISLLQSFKGDKKGIDKKDVYISQFSRAFKDTALKYSDFTGVVKLDSDVAESFVNALGNISEKDFAQYNPILLLQAFDQYNDDFLSKDGLMAFQKKVSALWKNILVSDADLKSLTEMEIKSSQIAYKVIFGLLNTMTDAGAKELYKKMPETNRHTFLILVNQLYKDVKFKKDEELLALGVQNIFKNYFESLLPENSSYFMTTFSQLQLKCIDIQKILFETLKDQIQKDQILTTDIDPIGYGRAVESVKDLFKTDEYNEIVKQVLKTPLYLNKNDLTKNIMSYQLLDNYNDGKLVLPGFYTENDFIVRLIERSISESKILKNPTVVFRLANSGLFSFFSKKVGASLKKDADKATVDAQLAKDFAQYSAQLFEIVKKVNPFYQYAVLVDASVFAASKKVVEHPIEKAVDLLASKSIDDGFKNVITNSYDGSTYLYLLNETIANKSFHKLLLLEFTDVIIHTDIKTLFNSEAFTASQLDKKKWDLVVSNKKYALEGMNSRAPSTICYLGDIIESHNAELKTLFADKEMNSLMQFSSDLQKQDICKKPKK